MTNFAIYFDYMTEAKKSYEYIDMQAKDLEEAIEEADLMIAKNDQPIYLTRIMKKTGKTVRKDGVASSDYTAILCKRSHGWHRNIEKNGENEHIATRWETKYFKSFEAK